MAGIEIGVALPTTVPDKDAPALPQWARRAEELGFASLGVLDRLVYDNFEPLTALAAAAAVTSRIRLASTILIAACRGAAAPLAKQAATVDALSGGRLVLGLAAGGREDDYRAAGVAYGGRGARLDALVGEMREIWAGHGPEPGIGPRPHRGTIPLLFGGHAPTAMRRAARYGTGWIAGGSSVTAYADLVGRVRQEWARQGRTDRPRMVALVYACLGQDAERRAADYLRGYYSFIGAKADRAASGVLVDAGALGEAIAGYAESGCDELIVLPCTADPLQLDLLAKAALG